MFNFCFYVKALNIWHHTIHINSCRYPYSNRQITFLWLTGAAIFYTILHREQTFESIPQKKMRFASGKAILASAGNVPIIFWKIWSLVNVIGKHKTWKAFRYYAKNSNNGPHAEEFSIGNVNFFHFFTDFFQLLIHDQHFNFKNLGYDKLTSRSKKWFPGLTLLPASWLSWQDLAKFLLHLGKHGSHGKILIKILLR